ncbi:MAG: hypothetical protein C0597_13710 [Marinilabiliales bacterium]|nr:MAG: hypothetical protein C0597_13710 [Marinilabiliales bacterium]
MFLRIVVKKSFGLFFFVLFSSIFSYSQKQHEASTTCIINKIIISGNTLTKEDVVKRELEFELGEEISLYELPELIERSRENLLNTSLFNFVTITYTCDSNNLAMIIDMQERWYVWPYPVLEHADRNFSSFLKNQEWSRINYGLYLLINNFRGRKEILKLKTIFGFNNELNLFYYKPYVDKNQKIGIGLDLRYIRNHEVPFNVFNDELEYLKLTNKYAREKIQISNFYTYRPQLYTNHLFNLKYSNVSINDSVLILNDNYFFEQNSNIEFITLGYIFDYDKRNSKIYPLEGIRINLLIQKEGLGVFSSYGNFKFRTILDENIRLAQKFFLTTSITGQLYIKNKNSFYFSEAIGYDNYLRGMEYYVSNGNSFYISKANFKYEIIPQTNFNINIIPTAKFSKVHFALYTNIFFDTGYVDSNYSMNNAITNEFLYSGGIGLDLVTYYDKVLRIEYSLNKFGEQGIFVHLGAPLI